MEGSRILRECHITPGRIEERGLLECSKDETMSMRNLRLIGSN